jgi:hypothetical protein
MSQAIPISIAVEGIADEAVALRLIAHAGGQPGTVYGKQGKPKLRQQINGYASAALYSPWFVLVYLDHDADCAPLLRNGWVPRIPPQLCFRVAVRAVETWLIADSEQMAAFIGLSRGKIPDAPEALRDPKRALVDLARQSRKSAIRMNMVPRDGSGRPVGPAYTSRLIEFATSHWRPDAASRRSESLQRAIACLLRLLVAA